MDCQWVLGSTYWNTSWSKANVFQNCNFLNRDIFSLKKYMNNLLWIKGLKQKKVKNLNDHFGTNIYLRARHRCAFSQFLGIFSKQTWFKVLLSWYFIVNVFAHCVRVPIAKRVHFMNSSFGIHRGSHPKFERNWTKIADFTK